MIHEAGQWPVIAGKWIYSHTVFPNKSWWFGRQHEATLYESCFVVKPSHGCIVITARLELSVSLKHPVAALQSRKKGCEDCCLILTFLCWDSVMLLINHKMCAGGCLPWKAPVQISCIQKPGSLLDLCKWRESEVSLLVRIWMLNDYLKGERQ